MRAKKVTGASLPSKKATGGASVAARFPFLSLHTTLPLTFLQLRSRCQSRISAEGCPLSLIFTAGPAPFFGENALGDKGEPMVGPCQPPSHSQTSSLHCPWPLQAMPVFGSRLQVGISQKSPRHPLSHMHVPFPHLPWPPQPCSHRFIPHALPCHDLSHRHLPR